MSNAILPKELISLIHHIELNKAQWWDKAVQQLVVACIWLSGEPRTLPEIASDLYQSFSVNIDAHRIKSQIDTLCASERLVSLPEARFKISEASEKEFERNVSEMEELDKKVKARFSDVLATTKLALEPEQTWISFNEHFLVPLVREMGAKLYEILSRRTVKLEGTGSFQEFLQCYSTQLQPRLRAAMILFLDPKDADVRSYILRSLNAYFFVEASSLGEDTLEALGNLAELESSFIAFVDTNFLFSILALHENPSNEAAHLLKELITQLSGKVEAKLYVLPTTVDEVKRVLIAREQSLTEVRLTPNLAEAALEAPLDGIGQKFVEECRKAGRPLRAKDYFHPYIADLITVLRGKDVEFFNEKIDHYHTNQEVIDNVNEQLKFEKARYPEKPKGYEQLVHDMILWHFVRDKRSVRVESPLEAVYWILTVDYRFLAFDAFKAPRSGENIPICIHPTTLIQMLQFWVPRTPEFEQAMLSSMRLPFLFQEFDPTAERVTIRILETLGRFENVADLPTQTVTTLLLNDVLRQRLLAEPDVESQVQLIKEALIQEHETTQLQLKQVTEEVRRLEREKIDDKQAIQELGKQLGVEAEKSRNLKSQLQEEQRQRVIAGFVRKWFVFAIILVGLSGILISSVLVKLAQWPFWGSLIGLWSGLLIPWLWITDRRGSKDRTIKEWKIFHYLHKFKRWVFTFLSLVLSAFIIEALSGWLRPSAWLRGFLP